MMAPAFATAFGFNGSPLIRWLTIRRSVPANFDDEDADQDDDDDDKKEDNDKVEDNDKDDNNLKDISALGLDRDMEFSRKHPTKSTLTIPNQTKPKPIKPY